MNTHYTTLSPVVLFSAFALCQASAAESIKFIPATPENTTLVDGSPLNTKEGEGAWKWLPDEGNHGIFESYGDPKKNAPTLLIMAKDLEPGRDYEVFGFFWAHGFGPAPASRGNQPFHWPAGFGLGLASLTTYGGRFSPEIPWIISPGSNIGGRLGFSAILEEKSPEIKGEANWITAIDDTRLIRARLGLSRAGKDGTLPVYADDFPDSKFCGRTRIDGIGLRLMPAGNLESVGAGKPGFLHLAVRAGDTRNMRRELASGADVNALDEDGVTALLYPVSSGDQATVRELLKAGANPNQPGQSILPLTGAASWGDTPMIQLLLEAGAEVPGRITQSSPLLSAELDAARLHPAIAAIRAGSLGSLKRILEKKPDLDLEALGPENGPKPGGIDRSCTKTLVKDTILSGHDELAAFLINRGCKIDDPDILPQCMQLGDDMVKTRESLFLRGVAAIQPVPYNRYTEEYLNQYEIEPWDALSSAVFMGNVVLTKRFLPLANKVDERYQQSLHALANWSGQPEILAAVRKQFPANLTKTPATRPDSVTDNDETLRLYLPRTGARKERPASPVGIWTLAVITSPEAAGPAAAVEIRAANGNQWKVVDRSEIEAALKDNYSVKPWQKGEHHLAELGDRFSADALLLVTRLESEKVKLLRFETVAVASGLVVHREYMEEKTFEKETDSMLTRIRAAIDKANAGEQPLAISLLSFTASNDLPNEKSLASQFRAAMEIEVDAAPGLLAVGMKEIQTIAREQALAGKGSFWAAAYTLEGGLAALPNQRVSLTLRLRNLADRSDQATDARVEGALPEIPELTSRAWRQLLESGGIKSASKSTAKPTPAQTAAEVARLIREAEWLLNCDKPHEAKPLLERAEMLGAAPEKIIPMIFSVLVAELPLKKHKTVRYAEFFNWMINFPLTLSHQKKLVENLESSRELLHRAAALHSIHGKASLDWKRPLHGSSFHFGDETNDFWNVLRLLSFVRASIPKSVLKEMQLREFEEFSSELDQFTVSFFRNITERKRNDHSNHVVLSVNGIYPMMLKRNPELLNGISEGIMSSTSNNSSSGYSLDFFPNDFRFRLPHFRQNRNIVIQKLLANIDKGKDGALDSLRHQFEMACITGDDFSSRGKIQLIDKLKSGTSSHRNYFVTDAALKNILGTFDYFREREQNYWGEMILKNKNSILPCFVHEAAAVPDCIARSAYGSMGGTFYNSSEKNANFRINIQYLQNSIFSSTKKIILEALPKKDGIQIANNLLDGAALQEICYGIKVVDQLSKEFKEITTPKTIQNSLAPRLLLDLRVGPDTTSGIVDIPMPDTNDPKRLWLRYHPFEKGLSRLGEYGAMRIKSWLLAIDCGSGSIERKVDLSAVKELNSNDNNNDSLCGSKQYLFNQSHLVFAQTPSKILTKVEYKPADSGDGNRPGYALISKADGTMKTLPAGTFLASYLESGIASNCVESIGGDFYFLRVVKEGMSLPGKGVNYINEFTKLDDEGRMHPISKAGRKPELTPFDAEDLDPKGIFRDGNRLLVIHDRSHIGKYDPSTEKWEMSKADQRANFGTITNAPKKSEQTNQNKIRNIETNDKKITVQVLGDANGNDHKSFPEKIVVSIPGKGKKEVDLKFVIPEAYKKQVAFTSDWSPTQEDAKGVVTCDELLKAKRLHVEYLSQTEKDLILGLRIETSFRGYSGDSGLFLPFLWALPKSELFRNLGISDTK